MRKTRFKEEQIIRILRDAEAGRASGAFLASTAAPSTGGSGRNGPYRT